MQNCLQLFTRFFNPVSRRFWAAAFVGLISLGGCTTSVDETQRNWMNKIFRPYVPDIVQGNFVSSEQYSKLQLGMTREQVRQILGTPLLADYFHANRWDYVFEFKRNGQVVGKDRRVTVFFEGDKVVKFDGDALPTDVELVAEIDNYAKAKRSFWQIITGTNKPPETPPLQQPELMVPSKTDNLPAGTPVPVVDGSSTSSFWDFFSFSKKPAAESVPQPEALGPGAMNVPPANEAK